MTGKKNFLTAIKRAVSPSRQKGTASIQAASFSETVPETTPFTTYVLDNLNLHDNEHKLLAMVFAPQIQTDCDAQMLDFDDYFYLLGQKNKADALRTLKRALTEAEIVSSRSAENSVGRPKESDTKLG